MKPERQPPRWAQWLLERFIREQYREEIEGDLEELFADYAAETSYREARRMYARETLRLITPRFIKNFREILPSPAKTYRMYGNYFKAARRHVLKHGRFSIINIVGLTIGISVCLLIFMVIRFELSYDQFHPNKDRIYRIISEMHDPAKGDVNRVSGVPVPLPYALRRDFPQLEAVSGIYRAVDQQVQVLDPGGSIARKYDETKGVFYTEASFFSIFDFPWLAGDPRVLGNLDAVVLTKDIADAYFGNWQKAMGRVLKLNNQTLLKVEGIVANPPPNTDFQFHLIVSYESLGFRKSTDWFSTNNDNMCYVLLPKGLSHAAFDRQLRAEAGRYRPADSKDTRSIEPLSEVHYQPTGSHIENFIGRTVDPAMIRTLWLIAGFILLVACVNFINLSMAQAVNRAREIGVRKVLGSNRLQLRMQFVIETLIIVGLAIALSVLVSYAAIGPVGAILSLPLVGGSLFQPVILVYLLILTVVVTLLASVYPSIVLSSFNPVMALKSKRTDKARKGISLRRSLVVFQFAVAQVLIIATVVMVRQIDYFLNTSLGFDKDAIVNIPFPTDSSSLTKLDYMKDQLTAIKGVRNVTLCSNGPADEHYFLVPYTYDNESTQAQKLVLFKWADSDYLKTYEIQLAAGRDFEYSDSTSEFIVNECFLRQRGISDPSQGLNKPIDLAGGGLKGRIVGVVKDFHATSLKDPINPIILINRKGMYRMAGIRLATNRMAPTIKAIASLWQELFPAYVFNYQFLSDKVAAFYRQEDQVAALYKIFAGIAILLSCLGLYGLSAFMAVQRVREVAVRKVLGASVMHIVYLFSREFVILVGIAFVIAAPLARYFMNHWLDDYAYRITIGWTIFFAGGFISLLTAVATVCIQAVKAARAKPVQNLRGE